jgi:hypothetical protein
VSEVEHTTHEPDPDESPFEAAPIEGLPFEKGSEEDLAIQRILEEADARKERPE